MNLSHKVSFPIILAVLCFLTTTSPAQCCAPPFLYSWLPSGRWHVGHYMLLLPSAVLLPYYHRR
jgi:hypothetical protein